MHHNRLVLNQDPIPMIDRPYGTVKPPIGKDQYVKKKLGMIDRNECPLSKRSVSLISLVR